MFQPWETLARQPVNSVDQAREVITNGEALAPTQAADDAINTLRHCLELRGVWGFDFIEAFQKLVLLLEGSPLSDDAKGAHRRAIADVVRRNLAAHPALQDWLDQALGGV
jgi:hypothetical protein